MRVNDSYCWNTNCEYINQWHGCPNFTLHCNPPKTVPICQSFQQHRELLGSLKQAALSSLPAITNNSTTGLKNISNCTLRGSSSTLNLVKNPSQKRLAWSKRLEITSVIDRGLASTFIGSSPRSPNRSTILDSPLSNQRKSNDVHNSWNYGDWMSRLRRHNPSPMQSLAGKWREYRGASEWRELLDPLDENLRREIVKYGEFAQATYDAFNSDTQSSSYGGCCIPCGEINSFLEKVGLRNTGYRVTKYLHATPIVHVPNWLAKLSNDSLNCQKSNWMGFVAVSDKLEEIKRLGRRDIVIAWRGTMTPLEWAENLKGDLKPIKLCDNIHHADINPRVENGFLRLYTSKGNNHTDIHNNSMKSASEQVLEEVQRLLELYEGEELSITITGHSLGAALALLSAYQIGENFVSSSDSTPIAVFSFGGPRVGNHDFKQRLEDMGVKTLRIVNTHDWIPQMPGIFMNEWLHKKCHEMLNSRALAEARQRMSFTHVGAELRINHLYSPYLKENAGVSCCHNLEAHLHLVDGFQSSRVPFRPNAKWDYVLVNKTCNLLKDELRVPANWHNLSNHYDTDFTTNFNHHPTLSPLLSAFCLSSSLVTCTATLLNKT